MSQLVKMKPQANFKDLERFRLVEQKKVVFDLFVYKLGSFWHEWASLKHE
jgi:hypothetical protein